MGTANPHNIPRDKSESIEDKIEKLKQKYAVAGQDLGAYLDGLIYSDYLTYWDYIHLDTLLSLQNPKTNFPDEKIFIMYHQITELFFKLSMHELTQLSEMEKVGGDVLKEKVRRINNYFKALTASFDIMINGMDKEQFLKFRMALLPASGFQSGQYRMIEICATEMHNLVDKDFQEEYKDYEPTDANIEKMYEKIYWMKGATELSSGKKTLTLQQFEKKYSREFIDLAKRYRKCNVWTLYKSLTEEEKAEKSLQNQLRMLDVNVNINWPLVHYKSAVRYLQMDPVDIAATGGTNWQKYLPPRFQKRIFYPGLWTEQEIADWGKKWVDEHVLLKR